MSVDIEQEIARLEARRQENCQRIEELRERIKGKTEALQREFERDIEDLEQHCKEIDARIHQLREKDADAWEDDNFLTALHEIFDEIGERIDHLFSRAG